MINWKQVAKHYRKMYILTQKHYNNLVDAYAPEDWLVEQTTNGESNNTATYSGYSSTSNLSNLKTWNGYIAQILRAHRITLACVSVTAVVAILALIIELLK